MTSTGTSGPPSRGFIGRPLDHKRGETASDRWMRTSRRAWLAAAAIVIVVGVGGCSSKEPTATLPRPAGWAQLQDQPTGVRFALPRSVEPQSEPDPRPGGSNRVYQETVNRVDLIVGVLQADGVYTVSYIRGFFNHIVSSLMQEGSKDARLSSVEQVAMPKGDGLEGTLTYTSTAGKKCYQRYEFIANGHMLVDIGALACSGPGASDDHLRADAVFNQMTGTVGLR